MVLAPGYPVPAMEDKPAHPLEASYRARSFSTSPPSEMVRQLPKVKFRACGPRTVSPARS